MSPTPSPLELDARPGPARAIDESLEKNMVSRALAAFDEAVSGAPARPARRPRHASTWLLAAALLVVLSAASAAAYLANRKHPLTDAVPAPASAPATVPATPSAEPAPAPPASTTSPPVAPTSTAPTKPSMAPKPTSTEDLLQTANEQRIAHRWADAEKTYQRVITIAPGSAAAYTATVAAASLRLDHLGDASGALRLYRSALSLRPGGALSEEARWGVAEAERALGDVAGEKTALRAFIAAHPSSLMAPTAKARLEAIEAGE